MTDIAGEVEHSLMTFLAQFSLRRSPERFPAGRAGEVELPGMVSQVDSQLRPVLKPGGQIQF